MDDASTWALIWLAVAAVFGIGELLMAGSFFLLPFAAGALIACLTTVATGSPMIGLAVFIVASLVAFFALRPVARKLDENAPDVGGIGANRLIGATGVTLTPISATPGNAGMVQVGAEEWRADSHPGTAIAANAKVTIVDVQGTRLIVEPDAPGQLY